MARQPVRSAQARARSSAASNHGSFATAYSSVVATLVASSVFIVA